MKWKRGQAFFRRARRFAARPPSVRDAAREGKACRGGAPAKRGASYGLRAALSLCGGEPIVVFATAKTCCPSAEQSFVLDR